MKKPSFIYWLIICFCLAAQWCAASKKTFQFSKNGDWCEVSTATYKVKIRTGGTLVFDVKNTMVLEASFIQRWTKHQFFPHVQYVEASVEEDQDLNTVTLELRYFWNDGRVLEKLVFTPRLIMVEYVYTPSIRKLTRNISCVLKIRKPKKQPASLKIMGIDRNLDANGALLEFDTWKTIKRLNLRMASVRGLGEYIVDVLADGNALISMGKWPGLVISDTGTRPFCWNKSFYESGEPKKLGYAIGISLKDGRELKKSPVTFKLLKKR